MRVRDEVREVRDSSRDGPVARSREPPIVQPDRGMGTDRLQELHRTITKLRSIEDLGREQHRPGSLEIAVGGGVLVEQRSRARRPQPGVEAVRASEVGLRPLEQRLECRLVSLPYGAEHAVTLPLGGHGAIPPPPVEHETPGIDVRGPIATPGIAEKIGLGHRRRTTGR